MKRDNEAEDKDSNCNKDNKQKKKTSKKSKIHHKKALTPFGEVLEEWKQTQQKEEVPVNEPLDALINDLND